MRIFLITLLVFLLHFNVFSQRFGGGILGGIVGSQLDGDHRAGYNKFGFVVGAFIDSKFNKKWGFQFEMKFIQKGSKGKDTVWGIISFYHSILTYIEMPVLVNYFYKDKYKFEFGLSAGYLVKAMEDKDGYGFEKALPEFNKFEFAATVGVVYLFSEQMSVAARFTYSALPVRADYSGAVRYIDRGQYNNVLSLALFYKFRVASQ